MRALTPLRFSTGSFAPPSPRSPPWPGPARWLSLASAVALAACAGCARPPDTPAFLPPATPTFTGVDRLQALLPADVLLLGEQHDAPDHQRLQRGVVTWLVERGQLAALVMEMAERGHSTNGLSRTATEAQVQAALQWNDAAWPWRAYGPVVMAAVAGGVPVYGGNLPRAHMREAMAQTRWDQHLPPDALQWQYEALREGHCGLLPESQIAPMARIQIARDASMAQAVQNALRPRQTVVLVAGGGHVLRSVGVPTHWPENIVEKVALAKAEKAHPALKNKANPDADLVIETPELPAQDVCAPLREKRQP